MDASARATVEAIHATNTQAVLYFAGVASQALGWLMSVPGASNTVLEAVVPYSRMSLVQLLGKVPTQFFNRRTAEDMALAAYNRALMLSYPVHIQPALFYKKAELFPGSAFVIGADTAARLINPKYYSNDYGRMLETHLGSKSTGCVFLVAGRNMNNKFKVLEDLDIPGELRDLFISIRPEKFRLDISSIEIRKSRGML